MQPGVRVAKPSTQPWVMKHNPRLCTGMAWKPCNGGLLFQRRGKVTPNRNRWQACALRCACNMELAPSTEPAAHAPEPGTTSWHHCSGWRGGVALLVAHHEHTRLSAAVREQGPTPVSALTCAHNNSQSQLPIDCLCSCVAVLLSDGLQYRGWFRARCFKSSQVATPCANMFAFTESRTPVCVLAARAPM